ncbi:17546_t:CDS:2, partial [Acaulospora morrowiae]
SALIEDDEPTLISEIHAGARLNGDIQFINHSLHLQFTEHQTDTNSENNPTSEWNVECKNTNTIVNVQKFKHCIINATNSLYGDAFLSLDQPDAKSVNEIHQYKHTEKTISQDLYQEERKKSSSENDFFILFTTSDSVNVKLPERSGIVDSKVFSTYFGPFAGRAYKSVESSIAESVPSKKIDPITHLMIQSIKPLVLLMHAEKRIANVLHLLPPETNFNDTSEQINSRCDESKTRTKTTDTPISDTTDTVSKDAGTKVPLLCK